MVTFTRADSALEVRHRHEVLRIEAWGTDSVRVRAAQYRLPAESQGALEVEPPLTAPPVRPLVTVGSSRATVVHGEMTVEVDVDGSAAYPEPLLTFRRTSTGEN